MKHFAQLFAGFILAGSAATVIGSPAVALVGSVDVSFSLSGSPGEWVYNFTVTNNTPSSRDATFVYSDVAVFSMNIANGLVIGSPLGWAQDNGFPQPTWCALPAGCFLSNYSSNLSSGVTLSNFLVRTMSNEPQHSIAWGINFTYDDVRGDDYFNRHFAGITGVAISEIPLPAALPLFVTGLTGLGFLAHRRKLK